MAERYNLKDIWAGNAPSSEVVDPDTDTTHPIYSPTRYADGWDYTTGVPTANKQPHEWRNFMLQRTMTRFYYLAQSGTAGWHPLTTYKPEAIACGSDGNNYKATKVVVGVDPVGDNTGAWVGDIQLNESASALLAKIQVIQDNLDNHEADRANPHTVQANQFAHGVGYFNYEVDILLQAEHSGWNSHQARKDNPHNVTFTQLSTLGAILGGEFLGQVDLTGGMQMNTFFLDWYQNAIALSTGGFIELGIHVDGYPIVGTEELTNKRSELFHEGNYDRLRSAEEVLHALPVTDIHLPLVSSLSSPSTGGYSFSFARPSTLGYTDKNGNSGTAPIDEDVYDEQGLYWTANTELELIATGNVMGECTVVYNTNLGLVVTDLPSWDGVVHTLVGNVATRLRDFRVYPRLSTQQKTMLA